MVSQTVKEAWQANEQVNKLLHLTPEVLQAQTPGGRYSVAQHLAHMTRTKKYFGMKLSETLRALPDLHDKTTDKVETNLAHIKDVMRLTSQKILEASEVARDKRNLTQTSVEGFLIHMMIHDGHHRGQILLALKTVGHPLPNEDLFWQPLNNEYE